MRIHFVVPGAVVRHLPALESGETLDEHWKVFASGEVAWTLQTYLTLRRRGNQVTCSDAYAANAVNVAHAASLRPFGAPPGAFIVVVQADYPRSLLADLTVVQNQSQERQGAVWLPHWPQPGLVPRDAGRTGVSVVAYAGRPYYMAGHHDQWHSSLKRLGLSFRVMTSADWNDFSEVDIVLGIRAFDMFPYNKKPPTKLLNAWLARIPFIGGADSAYAQVGSAGENYIRATTFQEALEAISALRHDPTTYSRLVAAGTRQGDQFTRDRIAARWEAFFRETVSPLYCRWRATRARWLARNAVALGRGRLRQLRATLLGRPRFLR